MVWGSQFIVFLWYRSKMNIIFWIKFSLATQPLNNIIILEGAFTNIELTFFSCMLVISMHYLYNKCVQRKVIEKIFIPLKACVLVHLRYSKDSLCCKDKFKSYCILKVGTKTVISQIILVPCKFLSFFF